MMGGSLSWSSPMLESEESHSLLSGSGVRGLLLWNFSSVCNLDQRSIQIHYIFCSLGQGDRVSGGETTPAVSG